jgi:hypothetical protein
MNLSDRMHDFTGKIMNVLTEIVVFINVNINFIDNLKRDELVEKGKEWLSESSGVLVHKYL